MDIINLPGWNVTDATEDGQVYTIHAEYEADAKCCPFCSFMLLDRHGRLERRYTDTPIHGLHVVIVAHRQRYKCQNCGRTFLQALPGVIEKHRMTTRLSEFIRRQSFRRTFVALAEDIGLDEKTIRNVFREYIRELDAEYHVELPECLGIDEIKLDGKYRCVLSDVAGRSMIDMLRNRDKITLSNYLHNIKGRERVRLIAMDMWNPYKQIVKELFPNAQIIVDKFHFVRMADEALNKLRKQISADLKPAQRRQLMHDRFLLLKRREDLEDHSRFLLDTWLSNFPTLAQAYALKEELHTIFDLPTRAEAEERYAAWRQALTGDVLHAFSVMVVAETNWHDEIFAYFDHHITNAYTESLNGLIKLTNRIGRGYSFDVIRARMLYGHLVTDRDQHRCIREDDRCSYFPHSQPQLKRSRNKGLSTIISEFESWWINAYST